MIHETCIPHNAWMRAPLRRDVLRQLGVRARRCRYLGLARPDGIMAKSAYTVIFFMMYIPYTQLSNLGPGINVFNIVPRPGTLSVQVEREEDSHPGFGGVFGLGTCT